MLPTLRRSYINNINKIQQNKKIFSLYSNSLRNFTVPAINDDSASYEVSTWDIKPTEFVEFLELTKKNINTRLKYGPLVGYWMTEIGGNSCQVVQLWKYADLDHRLAARQAMRKDSEWQKYMEKIRGMVAAQDNFIINKFPWASISSPPEGNNIWEYRQYTLKPGNVPIWANTWTKGLEARCKLSKPHGVFFSEIGPLNAVVHLWPYKSFTHRSDVRRDAVKDPLWKNVVDETMPMIDTMKNKVLIPLEFSPLK